MSVFRGDGISRKNSVVKDHKVFGKEYRPSEIALRRSQTERLRFCLGSARGEQRSRPPSAFLYGESGTGKSETIRHVLAALGASAVTVSCFESRTLHAVLERMVSEFRVSEGLRTIRHGLLGIPRASAARNKERLRRFLKGATPIVVLENVDKMPPKARERVIYNLRDLDGLTLILTACSRGAVEELDERVISRLGPVVIEFLSYSREDVVRILEERAREGLSPLAWNPGLLAAIARATGGNARSAIAALERLAARADHTRRPRIWLQDIPKATTEAVEQERHVALHGLNRHQKELYRVVKERGRVTSPELRRTYLLRCRKASWKPVADRTIRAYMNELCLRGLASQEPAAEVRGEAKLFRPR